MATGPRKTFTAVTTSYRLLKFGGARRILFPVDRGNLAKQTEDEFANYEPFDDPRKFPQFYTVRRLKSNSINPGLQGGHRYEFWSQHAAIVLLDVNNVERYSACNLRDRRWRLRAELNPCHGMM